NVEEDLNSERSVFNYYKKLIDLHINNKTILYGQFHREYNKGPVSVFSRYDDNDTILVICNFSDKEQEFKFGYRELIMSNYGDIKFNNTLPPYAALIVR
ncbi:MAG: glucohydrolase, partial [Clostridia bacterium]|nr:glucohydrolase [Clostridia bacterium]